MADFAADNKGLIRTFPPSGLVLHEPKYLSDTVQLVHPAFGPLYRIGTRRRVYQLGGSTNNGVKLVSGPVPDNTVRVVEYCRVSHDSAVARHLGFLLANDAFAATQVDVQSSRQTGPGTTYALGEFYMLTKALVMGPGDQFGIRVYGAADAVMNVDWLWTETDYSPADVAWTR